MNLPRVEAHRIAQTKRGCNFSSSTIDEAGIKLLASTAIVHSVAPSL
jgi:hypothetical protein